MIPLLKSLRPTQWTKNLFVFAGIIFALKFFQIPLLINVVLAFLIFCALSSGIYLINDLRDIEGDQQHPTKKDRPIASGQVKLSAAVALAAFLLVFGLSAAVLLNQAFALVALLYVSLMVFYSFLLRDLVIIDVFSIAAGFVLRAVAGVVVIDVELSPWLMICTILLALFIALGKRRHELVTLATAGAHRKILDEYSPQLLDQLISIVAGATIMAYALYTLWPQTIIKFGTANLVYSVPFVLYGIFRYMYLIYKKERGGRPEKILLTDLPLMIDLGLWILVLMLIVYWKG